MRERKPWSVYMLRTRAGALYTGIALDVDQRIDLHSRGRGAKALRGRGPLVLVFRAILGTKSAALRAEAALKRLTRAQKLAFLGGRSLPPRGYGR